MSIGIYKITSPKGRVYIGQSVRIELRFKCYKRLDCKTHRRLYSSFIKYGVDSHIFEILHECDVVDLNKLERHYQDIYNVLGKKGLNCRLTKSSDRSGSLSFYTSNKISVSNLGKPKHIGNSEKFRILNKNGVIGMLGKKHSEESKLKISKSHKKPMLGVKHSDSAVAKIKAASILMWAKRKQSKTDYNGL